MLEKRSINYARLNLRPGRLVKWGQTLTRNLFGLILIIQNIEEEKNLFTKEIMLTKI